MNIKKLLASLITAAVEISAISCAVSSESYSGISGDVNSDGVFNIADAAVLQKFD